MKAFRCPHCGGESQYDPKSEKIVCEYCNNEISVIEYQNQMVREGCYTANELTCPDCGAVIYSTDTTVATFCSYCGSSVMMNSRIVNEKRPKYIIPFKVDKEKAIGLYRDKIHRILLAPDWMEEEATVDKFRGIYMPFHLYRYTYDGTWEGKGTTFKIETENRKKYDVTRTYNVASSVAVDYNYIPADASSSFPDGMGRAVCPYHHSDMVDFKEPYLAGFYADSSDVDPELYSEKYESIVLNDMSKKKDLHTGGVQVPVNSVMEDIKLEKEVTKAMFPVWFMSYRSKDKVSYAAINGSTGEVVADIPIDFKKYLVASVIVAAIFSVILNIGLALTPAKLVVASSILSLIMFFVSNKLVNDTYRRKKHFDDAGYMGFEKDKVKKLRFYNKGSSALKVAVVSIILFLVSCFIVGVAETAPIIFAFIICAMPIIAIVAFVFAIIQAVKGGFSGIKRKKAPFYYKIFTVGKPLLAMILNTLLVLWNPVEDLYYYIGGIISIVLIILCAFDIVRAQNKYTMRNIPIFSEKRGGE